MAPLLEVKNLEVAFNTKDGWVKAVNGISYALEEGDTLGIVGESGCGKSVSVMSMLRLLPEPPAKIMGGEALFEGRDLLKMNMNDLSRVRGGKIAIIFQDPMTSLNPVMSIGDQIAEAMEVNLGMSHRKALEQTVELLERVSIPNARERLGNFPHEFSGGMRQRVMIAMAISCRPRLLIADEPTTALDVTVQAQIVDLVKQLQKDLNMTVIWITHDLGVVARLAKKINVMYAGYLVEQGPIKQVFKHPHHPYTAGLLGSLPGREAESAQELIYIEGSPPDMIHLPAGCPFHPRCTFSTARCSQERPILETVAGEQRAACWNMDRVQAERPGLAAGQGKG
jgi:oligopeptide transport system ATP-binding protein